MADGNMLLGGSESGGMPPPNLANAPPQPAPPGGANSLVGAPPPPSPQQMLAPILADATDPTTGEVNYNKAFVGLAGNPATSQLASGFLDQAVQRGATNTAQALKELENAYTKNKLILSAAKALLPLGVNVTQKELISAISSPEFSRAVPDPRMRAQILASAPKGGQMLANWVQVHAAGSETSAASMERVLHGLHAKLAEEALANPNANLDPEALLNAPGCVGKAAKRFIERYPQVLDGPRSGEKVQLLVNQLAALRRQEGIAKQHYSTLAGPGSPPFGDWWEGNLASQGIV